MSTVTEHVVGSYFVRTALRGVHVPEDRAVHMRAALVSTAKYLGRPLTAEEVLEAGAEIDRQRAEGSLR